MNRAKRPLAVTVCLLAAMCAMGLSATSAFADWLIEGKTISETVEVEGEAETELAFLVPSLNFQLVFKTITYDKGALLKGGETSDVILFTKGTTYTMTPKTELPKCLPGDLKFEVKGSLLLHNGKVYERLVPAKEGAPLTTTTYAEGCAITEKNTVTGNLVLEDAAGSFGTEAVTHLVRQASAALFPEQMKFGTNAMNLDGSWVLKLKGKEAGKKWSGTI
jgi:hypothetical protein